jgi:hypothetical protein
MACLGVHFALTNKEVQTLKSFTDDSARLEHLQEEIEETYMEDHPDLCAQSDKAWDAMHRLLSDGDFDYTWEWFAGVVALYQRAGEEGRFPTMVPAMPGEQRPINTRPPSRAQRSSGSLC